MDFHKMLSLALLPLQSWSLMASDRRTDRQTDRRRDPISRSRYLITIPSGFDKVRTIKRRLTTERYVAVLPSDGRVHRVAPRSGTAVRVAAVVFSGGDGSVGEAGVGHGFGHVRALRRPRLAGYARVGHIQRPHILRSLLCPLEGRRSYTELSSVLVCHPF